MTTRHPHQGAPSLLYSFTEWRALLEMALLPYAMPALMAAPRGDGHPVLLLPGFMADEYSLVALKVFLRHLGYDVQTWGFGRNVGFQRLHVQALEQKIRHLHHRSGRTVSLVGWSLGGLFALHSTYAAPECVRAVVTLGSPLSVDQHGSKSPSFVKAMYRLVAHPMGPNAHAMLPSARKMRQGQMPQVPISCLYSMGDGVVPPQEATIGGDPAIHENIRVLGSHTGLGFNAMVLCIVADRLAQPQDQWQPFTPTGVAGKLYRLMTGESGPADAVPASP